MDHIAVYIKLTDKIICSLYELSFLFLVVIYALGTKSVFRNSSLFYKNCFVSLYEKHETTPLYYSGYPGRRKAPV